MKDRVVGVPIDQELYEKLNEIAKIQRANLADLFRRAILRLLPELERESEELLRILSGGDSDDQNEHQ